MVTDSITSYKAKIGKAEAILKLKKEKLELSQKLTKTLKSEAKKLSGSYALEMQYKATEYAILEIENETEVYILQSILNEDLERYAEMEKREAELRERISLLPEIVDRIKDKYNAKKRLGKYSKNDSADALDFLQDYQSYMHKPNDVEATKLLRRADRIEFNLNQL
jgi:chromosome segregation ATPase